MKRRAAVNPRLLTVSAIVAVIGVVVAVMPVLQYRAYMGTLTDSELAVGSISTVNRKSITYAYTVDHQEYSGTDTLTGPDAPATPAPGDEIEVLYRRGNPKRSYTPYSNQGSAWKTPFGIGAAVILFGVAGMVASRRKKALPEPEAEA